MNHGSTDLEEEEISNIKMAYSREPTSKEGLYCAQVPLELFARKSESDFSHAVWPAACMRWSRLMEGPLAWVHVFPRAMDVHTLTHTQQIPLFHKQRPRDGVCDIG